MATDRTALNDDNEPEQLALLPDLAPTRPRCATCYSEMPRDARTDARFSSATCRVRAYRHAKNPEAKRHDLAPRNTAYHKPTKFDAGELRAALLDVNPAQQIAADAGVIRETVTRWAGGHPGFRAVVKRLR